MSALAAPLAFRPVYQVLVWGGRRMAAWREGLPEGPVGESWDLSDHERGMSVVADGPLAGRSLRSLVDEHGPALVGDGFAGGPFPLMVKLIDAADRLSVQVHPDDALATEMGLGRNGKTECWFMLADGGELYQGTRAGVDRAAFERALAAGRVDETLNRFSVRAGDFFFLDARTVHALGAGCLLYEIQQTCDVTFRVYDWGRMGLDGKPRPMHVAESLRTIDFARSGFGARRPAQTPHPDGGRARLLADCPYFVVEERTLDPGERTRGGGSPQASATIVIGLDGAGELATQGGATGVAAMQTRLVPAVAGRWELRAGASGARVLVSRPKLPAGEAAR
jgi:mannose-6-phosphate isomerase